MCTPSPCGPQAWDMEAEGSPLATRVAFASAAAMAAETCVFLSPISAVIDATAMEMPTAAASDVLTLQSYPLGGELLGPLSSTEHLAKPSCALAASAVAMAAFFAAIAARAVAAPATDNADDAAHALIEASAFSCGASAVKVAAAPAAAVSKFAVDAVDAAQEAAVDATDASITQVLSHPAGDVIVNLSRQLRARGKWTQRTYLQLESGAPARTPRAQQPGGGVVMHGESVAKRGSTLA
eukprot:6199412-Pleurochrysis_carterae.AAC.1